MMDQVKAPGQTKAVDVVLLVRRVGVGTVNGSINPFIPKHDRNTKVLNISILMVIARLAL